MNCTPRCVLHLHLLLQYTHPNEQGVMDKPSLFPCNLRAINSFVLVIQWQCSHQPVHLVITLEVFSITVLLQWSKEVEVTWHKFQAA
jgi:hypothetical protein